MAFSVEPESTPHLIMEPKNNSATDDFMAGLDKGEENPLEPQIDDLFPEDKEPDIKNDIEEVKPLPYHKDEKLQKYIEKQVEKRLSNFKPSATETFKQEVSVSDPGLVEAFKTILGDDTPEKQNALKALERSLANVDERATQKAVDRLQQVQQEQSERETREIEEAESELEEGFENIESHYGIELTERQKDAYKDFLLKIQPKGGYEEYPDFIETFDVFKKSVTRSSNSQAKILASRGIERSSSANVTPKLTSDGKSSMWQQVDKIFGN